MASEALKKIADELKTAREEKDISLQQIAFKTKIDIKFLHAIENANFDILPDLYMKAFIKEYALYIDLNPQSVLQKFENAKLGKPEEEPAAEEITDVSSTAVTEANTKKKFDSTVSVKSPASMQEENKSKKLDGKNYVYAGTIAVLVLIIIYIVFIKSSSTDIVQESFSLQTKNQDKQRFEMTGKNNNQTQQLSKREQLDSLRLSVQVLSRVWVKVSSDGKIITQQVYQPDSKLNFTASRNFSITIGNAGAVKLLFNNQPIQNIGNPGEIRNLFITPDTVRYYTIIPPTKNEAKPEKKN